jgi:hypothetical protein
MAAMRSESVLAVCHGTLPSMTDAMTARRVFHRAFAAAPTVTGFVLPWLLVQMRPTYLDLRGPQEATAARS